MAGAARHTLQIRGVDQPSVGGSRVASNGGSVVEPGIGGMTADTGVAAKLCVLVGNLKRGAEKRIAGRVGHHRASKVIGNVVDMAACTVGWRRQRCGQPAGLCAGQLEIKQRRIHRRMGGVRPLDHRIHRASWRRCIVWRYFLREAGGQAPAR